MEKTSEILDSVEEVSKTLKLLRQVMTALLRRKYTIVLCGTSGVGKSQFVKSMNERLARPIDTYDRTRKWIKIPADKHHEKLLFIDTPGQTGDTDQRAQAYLEAHRVKGGRYGVINVVANGFHEGTASEDHCIKKLKGGFSVPSTFLKMSKQLEATAASEWAAELSDAKWLITLINKADLWWTPFNFEAVKSQYGTNSRYWNALGPSWQKKHAIIPYAATFKPFYDRVPMSGCYSDQQRIIDHRCALEAVLTFIKQND
jgi:hypothetical protein